MCPWQTHLHNRKACRGVSVEDSRAQTHGLQLAGQGATPKLSDRTLLLLLHSLTNEPMSPLNRQASCILSVNGRLWQFNDTWARDSSRVDSLPPDAQAFLASHGQKQPWAAHSLPYLPAVRLPPTFHHLPALNQHPTQLLLLQAFSSSTPPPPLQPHFAPLLSHLPLPLPPSPPSAPLLARVKSNVDEAAEALRRQVRHLRLQLTRQRSTSVIMPTSKHATIAKLAVKKPS
ncbi:hypothetical protein V8C86DRAFT_608288 [Haematococcus lacustris]